MKHLPQLRLRTSVTLLMLATTLVTLAIVGTGILAVMLPRIADENQALVERAAKEMVARVNIFLEDIETRVAGVGRAIGSEPVDHLPDILGIARGDTIAALYVVGAIGDLDGRLIASSISGSSPERIRELQGIDLSTYPLYLRALESGTAVWSDKHISAVTGDVTVGLAVPAADGATVVIAEMSLPTLIEISRIAKGEGGLDHWIIDRKGEIVADTDTENGQRINLFSLPIVQAGLSDERLPEFMDFGERRYQVSAARSEELGWLVVSRIPAGLENAHQREVLAIVLVGFLGSAVVGLLLAPIWAQAIVRPLRAVAERAHQVASGAGSKRWPRGRIVELDQVSSDLAMMAETMLRREEDLRRLNEELEERVSRRTADLSRSNAELSQVIETLEQAKDELIQSEKLAALGRLVAGVAHELNTPLGNGRMAVSTLTSKLSRFEKAIAEGLRRSELEAFIEGVRTSSDIAERNLVRASELIGSFKQVAADRTSSRRRKFRLREVVDEVVMTLSPLMKHKPIELRLDLPKDLWLDSYPGELGQALTNLIENSVKHAFKDRERGSISVTAYRLGEDRVRIFLRDDGVGMAPEVAHRVFDPFYTTSLGQGGTGLGLFIVHNSLTNILGGSISLETRPGEGASFELRLPLVAPPSDDESRRSSMVHQAD